MALTFSYFASRGRGLALRLFLADKRVNFVDEQVPLDLAAWPALKAEAALSGRFGIFGTLPTLSIPGPEPLTLNESLIIAAVVSKLPEAGSLSEAAWAKSLEIASKIHLDVVTPLNLLLWFPLRTPGGDIEFQAKALRNSVYGTLARLDASFSDGRSFVVGPDTSIGDYFLFEALDRFQVAVGKDLFKIPANLAAFQARMAARPGIIEFIAAGRVPAKITGSPKEPEVLAVIQRVWSEEEAAAAAGGSA